MKRPAVVALWFLFFAWAMMFALGTRHVWEDYLITFRVSRNLAAGLGMVFQPGERVHAFTSPLNTLLPALFSFLLGGNHDRGTLWLYRIASIGAYASAALLLLDAARKAGLRRPAIVLLLGLFLLDEKTLDFTINGQETGLMMFWLALLFHSLFLPAEGFPLRMGAALGGLMWTRPDGFIYAGAAMAGFFLFADRKPSEPRRALLSTYGRAILLGGAIYLPWMAWAWWYFGSPLPHTVIAKSLSPMRFHSPAVLLAVATAGFALFPVYALARWTALRDMFMPAYFSASSWPVISNVNFFLAWCAALCWVFPFFRGRTRAVSFAFMAVAFYNTGAAAPWYVPNDALMGILTLGLGFDDLLTFLGSLREKGVEERLVRRLEGAVRVLAGAVLVQQAGVALWTGYEVRVHQRIVEEANRKPVGLWLKANAASSSDTVFLEPLGYIGYYSQLKMLDFPGLASREVVAARRKFRTNDFDVLIRELKPVWLVLRPGEVEIINSRSGLLSDDYSLAKTFDVSPQVQALRRWPGYAYFAYDQTFHVYHRKGLPGPLTFRADEVQ